jgi:hypothetical protein
MTLKICRVVETSLAERPICRVHKEKQCQIQKFNNKRHTACKSFVPFIMEKQMGTKIIGSHEALAWKN